MPSGTNSEKATGKLIEKNYLTKDKGLRGRVRLELERPTEASRPSLRLEAAPSPTPLYHSHIFQDMSKYL